MERVQALLLLVIQTLFTLVTSRPFRLVHTDYCQDLPVSALVLVASILFAVPVMLVLLSAFLRGDGPSPPAAGNDSVDERLRGRRFMSKTDRAHMHLKLSADGMTQRGWRFGGWRYALRLQAWRMRCLAKITCGYWDRDTLLATEITRRADCFVSHRLPTLPPAEHAVGLQLHQELMSATAKIASTIWMLLPAGIIITKFSEALNSPPWRIPEDVVEADSTSQWNADMAKLCRIDDIPNENKVMLIFNESKWVRGRRRTVQLSYVGLLLLFTTWPTELTFVLLFGIIAAREIIELVFDQEEPTYWRRHQEWKKRVQETTFRQTFMDWVEPRRNVDAGACELVPIVAPERNADLPASSRLMHATERDSQNGADEVGAWEAPAEVAEEEEPDEPLPPSYGRAPVLPTAQPSPASSRRALCNALELRAVAGDTRRALDAAVAAHLPRSAVDALRDRLRADEAAAAAAAAAADAEAQAVDAAAETAALSAAADAEAQAADAAADAAAEPAAAVLDGHVLARGADLPDATAAGDVAEAPDVGAPRDVHVELEHVEDDNPLPIHLAIDL